MGKPLGQIDKILANRAGLHRHRLWTASTSMNECMLVLIAYFHQDLANPTKWRNTNDKFPRILDRVRRIVSIFL